MVEKALLLKTIIKMQILLVKDNQDNNLSSLISFLKENGDVVLTISNNNQEAFNKIKDMDVIYLLDASDLAVNTIKEALKHFVPLVIEYQNNEDKKLYKKLYKYVNAIHYQNKDLQDQLEYAVGRRTNGHIFEGDISDKVYLEKLRKMLVQYADPINHNGNTKYYYSDELNDDFAFNKIKVSKAKKPFNYIHNSPIWKACALFVYYVIAMPVVWILNKLFFHQRIKNKHLLKRFKKRGYFIYSNHTNGMADAFTPNILSLKKNYIVVSRETISLPGLKSIVTMLGAIPVFSGVEELEPFNYCIKKRVVTKNSVTIYPEAHIWPYYTKIRHFKRDSFRFPVEIGAPVYVLTNTWQKRRFSKKPKLVSYLSGPLFPNEELGRTEAMEDLKERVYFEMIKVTRSVKQIEKIQYIKIER